MIRIMIACSGGTETMALIEARERNGTIYAVVTALLLLVACVLGPVRRRGFVAWVPLVLVAVLHPGIWLGARHGDCGNTLAAIGLPYTFGAVAIAALVYWRAVVHARKPY